MAYAGRVRMDPEIPALQAFAQDAADPLAAVTLPKRYL